MKVTCITFKPPVLQQKKEKQAQENSLQRELVYKLTMRVIWPTNVTGNGFSRVLSDSGISG